MVHAWRLGRALEDPPVPTPANPPSYLAALPSPRPTSARSCGRRLAAEVELLRKCIVYLTLTDQSLSFTSKLAESAKLFEDSNALSWAS
jgi:hypothetical protein